MSGPRRLHVSSAMVLVAGYLVSSFATAGAAGPAAVLLSEALVARASEKSPAGLRRWIRSMRPLVPVALGIVVINAATGPGSSELVAIRFPRGAIAVTAEAVAWGLAMALRLFAANGAFSLLSALADQDEMLFAVSNPSSRSSLAMALTLRLAPYMRRRIRAVGDAWTARGGGPKARSLPERVRGHAPVLRAAVYESLELSIDLAEAMYARGWGVGSRSKFPAPPLKPGDAGVSAASILGTALLLLAGGAGSRGEARVCAIVAMLLPAAVYAGIQRWSHVGCER